MKKISRWHTLFIAIAILGIFFLFSRQVNKGFLKQSDFAVTVKIQEKIDTSSRLRLSSMVGEIMEGSTFFASPEFSVGVIGVLTLLAIYDWKKKKIRLSGILIPICFALLIAGEIYGKTVVHHPSPPFFMIKNPSTVFPKYYINESFSYPSGHVARAVFIGIILCTVYRIQYSVYRKKTLTIMMLVGIICYIFLVSISRIYLGHHWLSDVIGGGLLGLGFGLLTLTMNSPIIDKQ